MMLIVGSHDTEEDYQGSLDYLKELIALHEKHQRILSFPSFMAPNAIAVRKDDMITGEAYDGMLNILKSLKEDSINRKPVEEV